MSIRSKLSSAALLACAGLLACTVVACQRAPQPAESNTSAAEAPRNAGKTAEGQAGRSATSNTSAAKVPRNTEKTAEGQADFTPASDAFPAEPKHQVVARYFHRTERCPTCVKISGLIEESVQSGFVDDLKSGKVKLQMVDYQDARNQEVTAAYKISDPMLVIMNVHQGKVTEWKLAPKVWALFMKRDAFHKYVQDEMHAYLEEKPAAL